MLAGNDSKKKAELVDSATVATEMNVESLPQIWSQIVSGIGGILAGQLQRAEFPAIFGPNTLVISFPAGYNAYYEHCSNPTNKQRIEEALQLRAGPAWTVRFEKPADAAAPVGGSNGTPSATSAPAMGRRARQQEAVQRVPLLKRAEEKLGAVVMDIEDGFGSVAAAPLPANEQPGPEVADEEG
jgi:hypothetical protein